MASKYWVGIWRGHSHVLRADEVLFSLGWQSSRDGISKCEMSSQNFENNDINETRPLGEGSSTSRCFLVQHREPSRHQVTARMKCNKEVNKV